MRKQVTGVYNPWNFDAEPGDRVIDSSGRVFDLRESRGADKRAAGELTPIEPSAQRKGRRAVECDATWYWTDAPYNVGGNPRERSAAK